MHGVYFYEDKNGREPMAEYIAKLAENTDAESRFRLNRFGDCVHFLSEYGVQQWQPYMEQLSDEIWVFRPFREGLFFIGQAGGNYVLLHPFIRMVRKIPAREIKKAQRELVEWTKGGVQA